MKSVKSKLYEGKAKIIFATDDCHLVIQRFKDTITAFNNNKKDLILGKGIINNYISAHLMTALNKVDIKTHFLKIINQRDQLVQKVSMIPLEIVIRNIACGSFCQRSLAEEGTKFHSPIMEFFYKDDCLSDPMISEEKILISKIASSEELTTIKKISFLINDSLKKIFQKANITLVDFKIEFGRNESQSEILLADEITPDTCRLWCSNTNKKLDKDVYRKNLGNVIESYMEVVNRLLISLPKY